MSPPPVSIHKEGLVNHYQRPDIKAILEQIRRARLRVRLAMNAASAGQASQELMACWQAYVHGKTMACLIHEQKSSDPQGSSELEFYLHEDGPIKRQLKPRPSNATSGLPFPGRNPAPDPAFPSGISAVLVGTFQ